MTKALRLTSYQPNFDDPRVKKRVLAVLAWCDGMRLSKQARNVHHDELMTVFGNTSRGLGQWLYSNLLSQSGNYQPGVMSYKYRLKSSGYQKLHEKLRISLPTELEIVERQFGSLISGEARPGYSDHGDRRYHPVQNIKRETRKKAFAGWWDYDIEACASTLLHQYAVQHHRFTYKGESPAEPFPAVARLVNDKVSTRQHIVELLGVDLQKAKELLTAILFRANLAPSHKATVFLSLGGDLLLFRRLLDDEFIKQLRADVKSMWLFVRLHHLRDRAMSLMNGHEVSRVPDKASKYRMAVYLSLERTVMDVLLQELEKSGMPVILMHDGFMSKKSVSTADLESAVLNKTGFRIKLSESELGADSERDSDPDVIDLIGKDVGEQEDEAVNEEVSCR